MQKQTDDSHSVGGKFQKFFIKRTFFIGIKKEQEFSGLLRAIFAPLFSFRNLIKKSF